MQHLIAISIPTYKRPDNLERCLASIICNLKHINTEVPVYVVDDSVSDINCDVINWAQNSYSNIIHVRNSENLGIDRNIKKSVDIAEADYVWLLGEDDLMVQSAVQRMLETLAKKDYAFIFANYVYIDNGYKNIISKKILDADSDFVSDGDAFAIENSWKIGFIGACVINKKLWRENSNTKALGTYFNHVYTILASIKGREVYVASDVLVLNRAQDTSTFTWSDQAFDVFFGWQKMLDFLAELYGPSISLIEKNSRHLFNPESLVWVMSKRADGLLTKEALASHYRDIAVVKKLCISAVILLPRWIFRLMKFCVKTLPRKLDTRPIPPAWLG